MVRIASGPTPAAKNLAREANPRREMLKQMIGKVITITCKGMS
jgi:hypothetical protein